MKRNISLSSVFYVLILIQGCTPSFIIERGVVKKTPAIKFVDKDITLIPDQFFTISQLGLKANSASDAVWNAKSPVTRLYERRAVESYPITIEYKNKKFYGRIAFFKAWRSAKKLAVTSYYKITIPDQYFLNASDGRTSCVYELYYKGGGQAPTWMVWISDIPI